MKALAVFTILICCISCGKQSVVSKKLAGCDSLVITFNAPNSDSVRGMVNTTEKKAIRKLIGFLDGKEAEMKDCGFDGSMVFFRDGQQVMPVVFKYSQENCQHFLFDADNKVMSTKMNNEEVKFLESLSAGRSWY